MNKTFRLLSAAGLAVLQSCALQHAPSKVIYNEDNPKKVASILGAQSEKNNSIETCTDSTGTFFTANFDLIGDDAEKRTLDKYLTDKQQRSLREVDVSLQGPPEDSTVTDAFRINHVSFNGEYPIFGWERKANGVFVYVGKSKPKPGTEILDEADIRKMLSGLIYNSDQRTGQPLENVLR